MFNLRKNNDTFSYLFLGILVLSFCFLFFKFSYNFPFWDDWFVIDTTRKLVEGSTKPMSLLFEQHMEHRILSSRLFFLITNLVGIKDLRFLMSISIVGLLLIFYLIHTFLVREQKSMNHLVIVGLILFQFQYHQALFFSMSALQNIFIHVFSIFTFYVLSYQTKYNLSIAIVLSFFAVFTSGNGSLVCILGCVILLYHGNWRNVAVYSVFSIIILTIYYFDYVRPEWLPPLSESLKTPQHTSINFFSFFGNCFSIPHTEKNLFTGYESLGYFQPFSWIPVLMGLSLFLAVIGRLGIFTWDIFQKKKIPLSHSFLFFYLLFLILTGIAVALNRVDEQLSVGFLSRYRINGTLLIIFVYLTFISYRKITKLHKILAFVFAVAFNIYSNFISIAPMSNFQKSLACEEYSWRKNGHSLYYQPSIIKTQADRLSEKNISFIGSPNDLFSSISKIDTLKAIYIKRNIRIESGEYGDILSTQKMKNSGFTAQNGAYFFLVSSKNQYLILSSLVRNSIWKVLKNGEPYFIGEMRAFMPKSNIKKGVYNIYFLNFDNEKYTLYKTGKTIGF